MPDRNGRTILHAFIVFSGGEVEKSKLLKQTENSESNGLAVHIDVSERSEGTCS